MKSEIMLPNKNLKAEGKIIIEYTNGKTGEVENRFESENHAFPGGFLRVNNYAFANSGTDLFSIALSDRGDNVNYEIPFIPGNVIGYGCPNSSASGEMLGAENKAARNLGVYSNGKWHYKRQWSWLPSQITSEIKSFGIFQMNAGNLGYNERDKYGMCSKQIPYNGKGDVTYYANLIAYDSGIAYSCSNQPYFSKKQQMSYSVNKYLCFKGQDQTRVDVNLGNIVPIPSDIVTSDANYESYGNGFCAIDVDTNDFLVITLYKDINSIASVQVTRLDAELTTMKNNSVYKCGTYTKVSWQYPFSGYDASSGSRCGYYKDGKFYTVYGEPGTGFALIAEIDPEKWSESGDFMDAFTFSDTYNAYDGYRPAADSDVRCMISRECPIFSTNKSRLITNSSSSSSNRDYIIIIDPSTHKAYATRYVYQGSSNSYYFGKPFMYNFDGNNVLLQHIGYYNNSGDEGTIIDNISSYYRNLSDYTLYVLPDNAPKREEGQGVTITYEIAWGYEEDN